MTTPAFSYVISLDAKDVGILRTKTKFINFAVGRYRGVQRTLEFSRPIKMTQAIEEVEKYLSGKLTLEEFKEIEEEDDLFPGETFEEGMIRGDLLGGAKFLERIVLKDGVAYIICGS